MKGDVSMDIILASASPRRQQLLTQMGLTYRIHAVDIDEHMDRHLSPGELVETISREKAAACAALEGPGALIIAAGCNISMATPSCCPAGGLASGAGWTPVSYQMKWGWPLAAAYTLILAGVAYPLACLVFPA